MADRHSKNGLPQAMASLEDLGRPSFAPRAEIAASWNRSARSGLSPEKFEIPYHPDIDADGPLVNAARPVLDELSHDLATSDVGVVLADVSGKVLDRRATGRSLRRRLDSIMLGPGSDYAEASVGTNAIGTALEEGGHSVVVGFEHFAEKFTTMTCAAHPITDLRSGRVLGVIDLSCAAQDGSPLMSPLVRRAAGDIERRLMANIASAERVLLTLLAQEATAGTEPLVVLSDETMVTNAAARDVVDANDEVTLRDHVVPVLRGNPAPPVVRLTNGTFSVLSCAPVIDGGSVIGASLRLAPLDMVPDEVSDIPRGAPAKFGWESLTDTELSVARYVSQGLTNRGAAECMFISPYTVDSHLRSIYRKLGVHSRVELTVMALAHSGEWSRRPASGVPG